MTAITQRLLHLRPVLRPHPYSLHHFSSSSDSDPKSDLAEPNPEPGPQSRSSFSSIFNDVKASLQREPPPRNRPQSFRKPVSSPDSTPTQTSPPKIPDLGEIQRNLAKFSRPSSPSPSSSATGQYISLQELYNRNVHPKADDSGSSSSQSASKPIRYDALQESLRQLRANIPKNQSDSRGNTNGPMSLARFKDTLKLKPDQNAGMESSPSFSLKGKYAVGDADSGSTDTTRTTLMRLYNYSDLGAKLKTLRPEKKKGKWFSLHELNERLAKLRVIEEKESQSRIGAGLTFKDITETLAKVHTSEDEKAKKMQRLDLLSALGRTQNYLLLPPKDELVEKYFHPDNMSSAEKLKLELKKIRDEFKMSESDCGSARVQVAQLTTKIKHLSTVLQKKDKHSRRGLQAMVQRRKKLLKYLRRTDWDSYCLVLSKLGLRDNPDIKA